jgi:uncharacterized membrane protein (GlpM family)
MSDLIYWLIFGIVSFFLGFSIFCSYFVKSGDRQYRFRDKVSQGWSHAICFFVGAGGILYYFIRVRWGQIHNGAAVSFIDIILILFLLMSGMGLMPYFLINITKGIEAILSKIINKLA